MVSWPFQSPQEPAGDYLVFCDGRFMPLSEMRRLVAEDLERFRRLDEEKAARAQETRLKIEAAQKAVKKARWQAQWRRQFERWQALNERAERDAGAEERARQRKQEDQNAVSRLLLRIAEKEGLRRCARYRHSQDCALDRLSDHEYIELKFALASVPSRRWLAPL